MNITIPDSLPAQVSALLDQIGAKLGVAAGYVWTTLMRQEVAHGAALVLAALLPLALAVWACRRNTWALADYKAQCDERQRGKAREDADRAKWQAVQDERLAKIRGIKTESPQGDLTDWLYSMRQTYDGLRFGWEHPDPPDTTTYNILASVGVAAAFGLAACGLLHLVNPAYYALTFVLRALR